MWEIDLMTKGLVNDGTGEAEEEKNNVRNSDHTPLSERAAWRVSASPTAMAALGLADSATRIRQGCAQKWFWSWV